MYFSFLLLTYSFKLLFLTYTPTKSYLEKLLFIFTSAYLFGSFKKWYQSLVNSICDTFVEVNGFEPSFSELKLIFNRIEKSFADEANEESDQDDQDEDEDQDEDFICADVLC